MSDYNVILRFTVQADSPKDAVDLLMSGLKCSPDCAGLTCNIKVETALEFRGEIKP